ncbi:S-formylglutathione hydrolase-like [Adelges cooleyi]|uniref:S-formylglutathione hydrolase-like n=1 Tax=Adelges cooleyi TaxID=133065 RepID=UPI0021804E24|nr:S-formylglutathione hydrolase-like [Adelges cooleyi]XP_050419961.1 S-formylglutathione hydrolase-like [Adelges cooleyi]
MATQSEIKVVTNNKCFGGYQKVLEHSSDVLKCTMKFGIYIPPQENEEEQFPVLFYLSGLTCTEQNVITKAGFQRLAAQYKMIVVTPDTSPRNCGIPNEEAKWNVGAGASMYVNATQEPWNKHFQMYTYITEELYELVLNNFPVLKEQVAITGHSMGGHGALMCALRNPNKYKSVSALAPACNISNSPTLIEGLKTLIGEDMESFKTWDPTILVQSYNGPKLEILIHVGTEDNFLKEDLLIDNFVQAASGNDKIQSIVKYEKGYDHGYYFVSTFFEEHIKFHYSILHKYA